MGVDARNLGPLPIVDRNAEIEAASKDAMLRVFGGSSLIVREWTGRDYGVDAAIEVVVGKCPTNFVSQIQLKGTESITPNADGSLSLVVDVANLNYLLNGTSPLYLLFSLQSQQLWYLWAFDELKRLDSENRGWMSQKSVTLRFLTELHAESVVQITERIIEESKSRRTILDDVANRATTSTKVLFDPGRLLATAADEAYAVLIADGIALVASGLWKDVLYKIDILPIEQQSKASIQLVLAYANFHRGRCLTAIGNCAEASLGLDQLSSADAEILDMLKDACECQMGRITRTEYTQRQAAAAAKENASIQCKLEAVRFEALATRDEAGRHDRIQEYDRLASIVLGDASSGTLLKLQTRIHSAYLHGTELQLILAQAVGRIHIQRVLKQPWAIPETSPVIKALADYVEWENEMLQIIQVTKTAKVTWLLAEAKRTRLLVRTAVLGFQRFFAKLQGVGPQPDMRTIRELLAEADEVVRQFESGGHLEMQLRAKLAMADLHEIASDLAAAKQIACEVLPVAEKLRLEESAVLARQHLSGETLMQRTERQLILDNPDKADVEWARISDSDIDYYAMAAWSVSQLPKDRLPMIRKDVVSLKIISLQRQQWCKHLEQQQMLAHTARRETAYAGPTQWLGMCKKHKMVSDRLGDDFEIVIENFKLRFCQECTDRSPGKNDS